MFVVQCQETTPTKSFACEIAVRGGPSQFHFRVNCSALGKHEMSHLTKISRYTVHGLESTSHLPVNSDLSSCLYPPPLTHRMTLLRRPVGSWFTEMYSDLLVTPPFSWLVSAQAFRYSVWSSLSSVSCGV